MALYGKTASSATYFKPDVKIEYRPQAGVFKIYDLATREQTEVSTLKFVSVCNLQKYEGQGFTSNLFRNYFSDTINVYETDPWKYVGSFKYDKAKKKPVDESGDDQDLDGKTTLCAIGILPDGKTAEISLKGFVKLDVTKVNEDKSNKDKVKAFNDGVEITLVPQSEVITVGKKGAQKKIHLLDVSSLTDVASVDSTILAIAKDKYDELDEQLKKTDGDANSDASDSESSEEETVTADSANDVFDSSIDKPF